MYYPVLHLKLISIFGLTSKWRKLSIQPFPLNLPACCLSSETPSDDIFCHVQEIQQFQGLLQFSGFIINHWNMFVEEVTLLPRQEKVGLEPFPLFWVFLGCVMCEVECCVWFITDLNQNSKNTKCIRHFVTWYTRISSK